MALDMRQLLKALGRNSNEFSDVLKGLKGKAKTAKQAEERVAKEASDLRYADNFQVAMDAKHDINKSKMSYSERIKTQHEYKNMDWDKSPDKKLSQEETEKLKNDIRQRIETNRTNKQKRQDAEIDKKADKQMQDSAQTDAHKQKMEQMKEEARKRIEANREGYQRTRETRIDREAARKEATAAYEKQKKIDDLKEKIRQRQADRAAGKGKEVSYDGDLEGMGGEKSHSYSQDETNALIREAKQGGGNANQPSSNSSAFADDANNAEALRQANMSPTERLGGKINEAKQGVKDYIYDRTLRRKNITAERQAYNNEMLSNPDAMISSNGEYLKMRSRARATYGEVVTHDDIRNVKVGGNGKKSNGVGEGATGAHDGNITNEDEAAKGIAIGSFTKQIKDIYEWGAQDAAHAATLAGTALGVGLIGSELLDES